MDLNATKKSGRCADCGAPIPAGAHARWFPRIGLLCAVPCRAGDRPAPPERRRSSLRDIVRCALPDYRGRRETLIALGSVSLYNLNWDGGSRNYYTAVRLADGATSTVSPVAPWYETREGATIEVPPGFVVVESGYFCGKPSAVHVYCHPSDRASVEGTAEALSTDRRPR